MKKLTAGLFFVLFSPFAFSAIPCDGFSDEDIGEVVDYSCDESTGVCTEVTYTGNDHCLVNQSGVSDDETSSDSNRTSDDETSSDSNRTSDDETSSGSFCIEDHKDTGVMPTSTVCDSLGCRKEILRREVPRPVPCE